MTEPTNLQILVSEINHKGRSEYSGALKPLSVRLELPLYGKVVAISALIGSDRTSKNKIINDLLNIAVDEVYKNLTDDQKLVFDQIPNELHFSDDSTELDNGKL